MSEALKACPFCGGDAEPIECSDASWYVMCAAGKCGGQTPYGKTKPEAIERWNTRAQLPSQGGEAVAWAICKEPGRVDWLSATYANKRSAEEHVASYKDGLTLYITPLYTHPADQVADDLTMVKVPRELANIAALHLENSGYTETGKKLRALLNGGRS